MICYDLLMFVNMDVSNPHYVSGESLQFGAISTGISQHYLYSEVALIFHV